MIVDAGFLIAIERGEAGARTLALAAERAGQSFRTSHPVVAQVWREPRRQWPLARFLEAITIHAFEDGRSVGRLMAVAGTDDPIDAHLVQLAFHLGEDVLTGDTGDFERLASVYGDAAPTIRAWP